jgi:hypothetical protein
VQRRSVVDDVKRREENNRDGTKPADKSAETVRASPRLNPITKARIGSRTMATECAGRCRATSQDAMFEAAPAVTS